MPRGSHAECSPLEGQWEEGVDFRQDKWDLIPTLLVLKDTLQLGVLASEIVKE